LATRRRLLCLFRTTLRGVSFAKCWWLSISGTIWHGGDETRKLDQANADAVLHK
jgi:hypothetical protein